MDNNTTAILDRLEETSEEFWNISHQTGNFISMLIKAANIKNVLELGTSNGYSTLWIADALKSTNGHLTTIEFWEKRQCIARNNVEKCGLSEFVTFKIGQAYDIIMTELQNENYDMVFIDANKQEYLSLHDARSKMKRFVPVTHARGHIFKAAYTPSTHSPAKTNACTPRFKHSFIHSHHFLSKCMHDKLLEKH